MPPVGFEPTTPVFERAKTVHALDRAVTVIGNVGCCSPKFSGNVDLTFLDKLNNALSLKRNFAVKSPSPSKS
jgi:hypothetical protein